MSDLKVYELTTFQLSTNKGYVAGFKRDGSSKHLFPQESVELILNTAKRKWHWGYNHLYYTVETTYGPVMSDGVHFSLGDDTGEPVMGYPILKAHCPDGFMQTAYDYVLPAPAAMWQHHSATEVWPMSMRVEAECEFYNMRIEYNLLKHANDELEMVSLYVWRNLSIDCILLDALNGSQMEDRVGIIET